MLIDLSMNSSTIHCSYFRESDDAVEEIPSLPEVCRFGVNRIRGFLEPIVKLGLKSVLLFGVINKSKKVNFKEGT